MPSGQEIQQYFSGVWRLMMGRPDGMQLLDVSADGFWNSFFAILVALPALLVGWVGLANDIAGNLSFSFRLSLLLRLFLAGIGAWVLPLALLAFVAPRVKLADRYVHYVVATNWALAIFAWLALPPALLQLFLPHAEDAIMLLALLVLVATTALSWRLTITALGKGPAVGTAVFFAMMTASLLTLLGLEAALGVRYP